ncbi:MAG: glycogenin glucosyltransferase [Cirrosporium novae-zelandiae]|nr:MAG: glycogenin glucosyltransferase [Cirrosporium novae-zelandiae]
MAENNSNVYATLLMSDDYLPGALVLARSLRDNGTNKKLIVLVTLQTVSPDVVEVLKTVYDEIVPVDQVVNKLPANLYLMNRPDLIYTFSKIALWKLTQYSRIVYIDTDVVTLRAPDELFDVDAPFAAVPDIGWPDCFNSGVMVLSPNEGDYHALLALADRGISFDGADQGLLNMHFPNWKRLSFVYNCTPSASYQYVPAYKHFKSSINMVHFIGTDKPWRLGRHVQGNSEVYDELLGRWWAVYDKHYKTSSGFQLSKLQSAPPYKTFSAPMAEWDATNQPPPAYSRPEASNFPQTQYKMSSAPALFQAQAKYAESPKQVPHIFPWEDRIPKPTRVFATAPAPPEPEPESEAASEVGEETISTSSVTTETSQLEPPSPVTPTTQAPSDPWMAYTRINAWDEVPEIERYVRNVQQARRGKVQVLHQQERERRRSLKLTDFPTEVERPSLPVTPAPVQRPHYWGEEKEGEELPSAEGVPNQPDWDPAAKLAELQRRQSGVMTSEAKEEKDSEGKPTRVETPKPRQLPERMMPESTTRADAEEKDDKNVAAATEKTAGKVELGGGEQEGSTKKGVKGESKKLFIETHLQEHIPLPDETMMAIEMLDE